MEKNISRIKKNQQELKVILVCLTIICVCSALMFPILKNAQHEKVFVKSNATLIEVIGVILEINGIIQSLFAYDHGTHLIYFLLGVFFLFIACVFKLGIQMKEEQELTI